jgi:hypothetical protein
MMETDKERVPPKLPRRNPNTPGRRRKDGADPGLTASVRMGATWFASARRTAINAFLVFHIVSVACWCIPLTNPLVTTCRNLVRPYFLWSGLFQSWDMFSPSPKTINSYVEAIILYKDGNTRIWAFPRMDRISLTQRYFKERYRKFAENLKEDGNSALWQDAARFIARLNNSGQSPEKMVLLIRHWSDIVPQNDGSYTPAPWNAHVFYGYTVDPEDLK